MMIEEDEVESMRSGKDVDALQATLNRDIDGKNHSPSQLFATGNTGIGDANTNLHRHHAPKLLQICELFSVLRALVDGNRKRQLLILYDKYKKNEIPIEGFFRQVKDVAGRPTVELAISKLQQLRQGKMGIRAPGRPSHNRVSFTSAEISAQKSDPRGVHVNQLPSTSPGTLSSSATVQGLNKHPQQHIQLPSSSGTLSSSATSVGGLTKSTINRTTVPMFERPTSVNGPSRVQDAISHFQNNSSLPLDSPYSQGSVTKDQTVVPLPSVVHVKRESIDQSFDQAQKPCSSVPQGVSNVPMKQNHGNSRKSNDDLEKQSSKMVFSTSTTHASFVSPSMTTHLDSSTMVNLPGPSGTTLAGANVATTPKMPSVGHKNPRETLGSPLPPSRKKQKVCSTSSHRSISQVNDVTADSGINLEEEEEQLLSSIPKKDGHVSKASRRVVHDEEERTFLQKIPLQRKLTEIMAKSSIKHMNDDVKRCLSVCVEERMRGLLSNIIRLSKHRTDAEKCRNQTFITSDIRKQINEMNQKMKEEWERNHSEEKELKNAENDTEKEDCSKQGKANKEEKDKLRAKAANVAARAAVGGDDMFLKWKLMAEAHQKPSSGLVKNSKKPYAETGGRRFGKKQGSPKVVRSISVNDVIAVVEKEPQMSKSTLLYRLYNRICAEDVRTQEKKT